MKRNSLDYLNKSINNNSSNSNKIFSPENLYLNSLDNYKILDKIGEGMFSTVHLAEHIITGEKVAIKNLPRSKITSKIDKLRISREISILKKLHHFNIIKFYTLIETKESQFIIQEYCSGRELNEYIQIKKKLTEQEANKFFRQIISGLEYLSKNYITHRDLKPENLLLSNNMDIKIIDFGLSNIYEKNKLLKTACGSPCYAAPEMLQGKEYNGLSVDLWSAGIILFFMVSGTLPFDDINNLNLYKKIIAGKITYPKFFSSELKNLLKKILEVNPKKRAKLKEIKDSNWFNLYNNEENNNFYSEGININEIIIPIDNDILNKMKEIGFKKSNVAVDIIKNEYNNVTTTYYLLLKRKIKRKIQSNSDLFSDKFKEYIKDEKNHLSFYNNNIDDVIKDKLKNIFEEEKIEEENKKKKEEEIKKKSENKNNNNINNSNKKNNNNKKNNINKININKINNNSPKKNIFKKELIKKRSVSNEINKNKEKKYLNEKNNFSNQKKNLNSNNVTKNRKKINNINIISNNQKNIDENNSNYNSTNNKIEVNKNINSNNLENKEKKKENCENNNEINIIENQEIKNKENNLNDNNNIKENKDNINEKNKDDNNLKVIKNNEKQENLKNNKNNNFKVIKSSSVYLKNKQNNKKNKQSLNQIKLNQTDNNYNIINKRNSEKELKILISDNLIKKKNIKNNKNKNKKFKSKSESFDNPLILNSNSTKNNNNIINININYKNNVNSPLSLLISNNLDNNKNLNNNKKNLNKKLNTDNNKNINNNSTNNNNNKNNNNKNDNNNNNNNNNNKNNNNKNNNKNNNNNNNNMKILKKEDKFLTLENFKNKCNLENIEKTFNNINNKNNDNNINLPPFDLNLLYFYNKKNLKEILIKLFSIYKIKYKIDKKNLFRFVCNNKNLTVEFHINIINAYNNSFSYINFIRKKGDIIQFNEIIQNIISNL